MIRVRSLEERISRAIWKSTARDWLDLANVDVAIIGAGPSGMTAARYIAEKGFKVVVFERRLSFGGGIGGGGMLLHKVAVDDRALQVIKDFRVRYVRDEEEGLYVVDSSELMAKLAAGALDAGAKIVHGVHVEDVIYREGPLRIEGVVLQWSAVVLSGLHVDPLFVMSKAVVDATGHEAEVLRVVAKKVPRAGIVLEGEKAAYSELSERLVEEHTGRVMPGLYVAGMSVAALYGLPRMGPIFSSMLLSGKKTAELVEKDLKSAAREP